jgi:DNA-directed RNA polymerase subunit RPC12/RpoP
MALVHLDCPSCGGALSLAEGERIVSCRYCGGRHLILVPAAVPRCVVEATIDEAAALRVARTSLRRPGVARAARESHFDTVGLLYVPFFEATAVRLGTVVVRELVKPPAPLPEGEQSGPELDRWLTDPGEEREDTKVIEQDVVRIGPACDMTELGGERIQLAELRRGGTKVLLQPFDPVTLYSRGIVLAPSVPAERFLAETTWRVRSQSDATRYLETRLKLLYYPVWQARYRHRGRTYEVAVDGVAGTVLAGSAPRDRGLVAVAAAVGVGLSSLGVGRWLRWMGGEGGLGPAFLLVALAGGALTWLAWRWFQGGGEIRLESA